MECKIQQVTPVKCKLFDESFLHNERQLFQDVRTKATWPSSIFANEIALMKSAAEHEAYRVAHMTTDKRLQFQIRLSHAETDATTWSLADMESVTNQLVREIYGITSNEQKWFKKELSIRLIQFEAWWDTIGIQILWKTIEPHVL